MAPQTLPPSIFATHRSSHNFRHSPKRGGVTMALFSLDSCWQTRIILTVSARDRRRRCLDILQLKPVELAVLVCNFSLRVGQSGISATLPVRRRDVAISAERAAAPRTIAKAKENVAVHLRLLKAVDSLLSPRARVHGGPRLGYAQP